MIVDEIFRRFTKNAPLPVMMRALFERSFHPERLDAWFARTAGAQYTRELLFSTMFRLMSEVVCGVRRSIHEAYQASEDIAASVVAVYGKLARLEGQTAAELVRYSAGETRALMQELGVQRLSLVEGYRVKILDGNALRASERRLKELRGLGSAPLPGKALVVYEPALDVMSDVFPCEDGHAQERRLLGAVLETVQAGEVWIGDRNFCVTDFLFGIKARGSGFVIREHGQLRFAPLEGQHGEVDTDTGQVSEQRVELTGACDRTLTLRRIRVRLNSPTRDGERQLYILTNLPPEAASAAQVAGVYRKRWRLETAFQVLATALHSEIDTLAYPRAALFGFCVALVTYNVLAATKAALAAVHGLERVERTVSDYYVAGEVHAVSAGMAVALPEAYWQGFRTLARAEFAAWLREVAGNVRLSRFRKHPRGPKKPPVKQTHNPNKPHVSTAKIIAARSKRAAC